MKRIFFIIGIGLVLPLQGVFAADASFSFRIPEMVMVGIPSRLTLLLDPHGDSINAVSGSVEIVGSASIRRVSTSSSIIPLWVSGPIQSSSSIEYEGIIPGGFDGVYSVSDQDLRPGSMLSFEIITNDATPVIIRSHNTIYLNDGKGIGIPTPDQASIINPIFPQSDSSNLSVVRNSIFACGIILSLWFLRIFFKRRNM
jgi:hypothetical protein